MIGSSDLLHYALFNVFPHSLSMFACRRDNFLELGGADESLDVGEDVSLYLRLLSRWCDPRASTAVQNPPVHVRQALVVWRRDETGCDRSEMRDRYLRDAGKIYEEFFASEAGRDYRYLRDQVEEHLRNELEKVYALHFGLREPVQ